MTNEEDERLESFINTMSYIEPVETSCDAFILVCGVTHFTITPRTKDGIAYLDYKIVDVYT